MRCLAFLLAVTTSGAAIFAGDAPTTQQAAAVTQPASQPTTLSMRLENIEQVREEFDPLPKLPAATIAQVIRIAIDGGHVHVTTPLSPTDDAAVPVTDWPGRTRLNVGPAGSLVFHLKHVKLLDNDLTYENTEVITHGDYLQIVRETESPTGEHQVTLIQSRQFADSDLNPVRVLIHDTQNSGSNISQNVAAESFDKLPRQAKLTHVDLRQELLPILRDLGAADVFSGVTVDTAWQVLGGDVRPEKQIDDRLDQLLPDLSADDFNVRTAAEDALGKLGPAGAAALAQRDLTKLSPDARAAADNFLHRARKLTPADVTRMGRDPDFLMDAAGAQIDPRLIAAAVVRLNAVTGKSLDLPVDLPAGERQKRLDAFRASLSHATQPQ